MKNQNYIMPGAHWFLRGAVASVFLFHGVTKFPQLNQLADMMKMPVVMIGMLATVETLGALLILLGGLFKDWMTRLGAFIVIPVMLGAILKVHWGQWSFIPSQSHPMGGIEFQITLLMILSYLFVMGNRVKFVKAVSRTSQ